MRARLLIAFLTLFIAVSGVIAFLHLFVTEFFTDKYIEVDDEIYRRVRDIKGIF